LLSALGSFYFTEKPSTRKIFQCHQSSTLHYDHSNSQNLCHVSTRIKKRTQGPFADSQWTTGSTREIVVENTARLGLLAGAVINAAVFDYMQIDSIPVQHPEFENQIKLTCAQQMRELLCKVFGNVFKSVSWGQAVMECFTELENNVTKEPCQCRSDDAKQNDAEIVQEAVPKRKYKPWTEEEDNKIWDLRSAGKSWHIVEAVCTELPRQSVANLVICMSRPNDR
jgi:hypothetical protein